MLKLIMAKSFLLVKLQQLMILNREVQIITQLILVRVLRQFTD